MTLIFPAYNEAKRIANTVGEAVEYFEQRRLTYEIIVAADGNDGTREIVAGLAKGNPAIKVIGSASRGGKGLGIRNAVAIATGEFIGFSDADNKTPITEFDKFEPVLRSGADMAIGSRAMAKTLIERRQPWYRRVGSKVFAAGMRMFIGLRGTAQTYAGTAGIMGRESKNLDPSEVRNVLGYLVLETYIAGRIEVRVGQSALRSRQEHETAQQDRECHSTATGRCTHVDE